MASRTTASTHPNAVRSSLAVEDCGGCSHRFGREIGAAHLSRQFFRLNFHYRKLQKPCPVMSDAPFPTANPTA